MRRLGGPVSQKHAMGLPVNSPDPLLRYLHGSRPLVWQELSGRPSVVALSWAR